MPRYQVYTLFWLFCTPVIGFFACLPVAPVAAQSGGQSACASPAFFIEGIRVSARAGDAEAARRLAMRDARQQAWSRLVNRVLLNPAAGLEDGAPVRDLVDYVRVDSETVLPKRYRATLTYCFNQASTRAYFSERGLAYAELTSGAMLVLPVWMDGNTPRLWQPRPWSEAWRKVIRQHDGLVDLRLPRGGLALERKLKASAIAAFDRQAIARAAKEEGAEQVIVTVVAPVFEGNAYIATVTATLFNRDGMKVSEIFRRSDVTFSVTDDSGVMSRLAREIETVLETDWRKTNQISFRANSSLTLRVNASSIRDWSDQLEMLSDLAPVEDVKVIQLDSSGGQVRLLLSSSLQSLLLALNAKKFAIESRSDNNRGQQSTLVSHGG